MKFQEAIKCMKDGKKVKRANDCFIYYYKDDKFCCEEAMWKYDSSLISIEDVLAEDWEVVSNKQYWIPQRYEKMFYINAESSNVYTCYYTPESVDKKMFEIGNCFKTIEEANHMCKKLKVIHELRKFAYENNDADFVDRYKNFEDTEMWGIGYNFDTQRVEVNVCNQWTSNPFNIYFDSAELAQKAINIIGEDRIKKYYFDVEE